MKKFALAAVAALLSVSAASAATNDKFVGPRAEVTVGLNDVVRAKDVTDVSYGVNLGWDVGVTDRVTVGAQIGADNIFDRANISAGVRGGYAVTKNVLAYGTVGYSSFRPGVTKLGQLDGLRVGGGIDVAVAGPVYAGVEYVHTNYNRGVSENKAFGKIGIRF